MSRKKGHAAPPLPENPPPPSSRGLITVLLAAIVALTFVAYARSLSCGFTNWDDSEYTFYAYQQLQQLRASAGNIASYFFVPNAHGGISPTYVKGNFHPLSMLSMTLDYALSPAAPGTIPPVSPVVFHVVNVILHLFNTILVFFFIYPIAQFFFKPQNRGKKAGPDSNRSAIAVAAAASLLFGVHPLHVESVAWVSERKDVLYAFWFLLSGIAYLKYVRREKTVWYAASFLLFLLSLLSKGQAVSLAVVITLVDLAAGRNLSSKKVLLEKIPFYLAALVFGFIAVKAQAAGNAIPNEQSALIPRLLFASTAFSMYMVKTLVPTGLSTLYGYPDATHGLAGVYYLALILPLAVLAGLIYGFRKSRALFFGLGFFVSCIFLLLQLMPVGRALMADRYMYIASIGLFFCAGFAMEKTPQSLRWGARGLLIAAALVYAGLSSARCAVWQNSIVLWEDCIKANHHTPSIAYHNLAQVLCEAKDYRGAIYNESQAIRLEPTLADAWYNRANNELTIGETAASISDNTRCIALNPKHFYAYYLRGSGEMSSGRSGEAMADFDSSIALCPQFKLGFYGRALCREGTGNWAGVIEDYSAVLQLDANYADAYFRRALAYQHVNNPALACADLQMAARMGNQQAGGMAKVMCRN